MVAFGAIASPWAALAHPGGASSPGWRYATPIFAFAATPENDSGFAMLFRFGIMPMFLFSGTFFPVSPAARRAAARSPTSMPLWHGVDLCRDALARDADRRSGDGARGHLRLSLVAWIVVAGS